MVRNETVDSLKGLLIILVIIGHALFGSLDDNILRYVIYSFHMPVFLFISGYLLDYDRISKTKGKDIFKKYWKRMLLPWSFALVIYSLCLTSAHFTISTFWNWLLHPYYHLWYVPTLFLFIIFVWFPSLLNIKNKMIIFVSLIALGLILDNLHYEFNMFRMDYFIFFMIGVMAKEMNVKDVNLYVGMVFSGLFLIGVFLMNLYNISMDWYIKYLRLPSMLIICLLSILPVIIRDTFNLSILRYIGVHSLDIYLWHVLPIMFLKKLIPDAQNSCFYYISFFLILLLMFLYIWLKVKYSTANCK